MSLNHKSQSALEYMMTYGWAILVIVIVAAVLYSLGIFSPSSSLSTTITGFANLGTVNAVCLGGTSFTISMGDSTGYPINVTEINLTSSSGKTIYSPNILVQPNSIQTVTVPSSSLCTSGARYSVSAVVSYLEPGQIFPGPYTSTGTVAGTANSPPSSATSYEPITLTNTQNQGTPSPFQQMINVTSSSPGWGDISSSPFGQNVEFFSSTGQILDSWLENYTSTHAIWWVKLTSSIPAGSKQTIYMGFAPTSTNLFNTNNIGEAPQLSSTYAEYDDGKDVFSVYYDFVNTSEAAGWYGENYIIDNGLRWNVNDTTRFFISSPSFTYNQNASIAEEYVKSTSWYLDFTVSSSTGAIDWVGPTAGSSIAYPRVYGSTYGINNEFDYPVNLTDGKILGEDLGVGKFYVNNSDVFNTTGGLSGNTGNWYYSSDGNGATNGYVPYVFVANLDVNDTMPTYTIG
ncbi:MAG: DUF2341 domain-containing protein [Candidatus Parvarchaeota archaeon]|nr:DUF2341 domain-containing protein [Candidatus Parvarchaeota archaeon]